MKQDKRKILEFCIDGWRHLLPLEAEIPRSTLYRAAKELCSEKLLVHRRTKGYRTTKRGIRALHEEGSQAEVVEKSDTTKSKEEERGRIQKKPAVDLDAIQKFLQLPSRKTNFFSSLYPPLKKVPTPTHEAIIELILAEVCDRTWPETDRKHFHLEDESRAILCLHDSREEHHTLHNRVLYREWPLFMDEERLHGENNLQKRNLGEAVYLS